MTDRLYIKDGYLREFTATVIGSNADEQWLILDQTAFYPAGGGQPSDTGIIRYDNETLEVTRVISFQDEIRHLIRGKLPSLGQVVTGIPNWERRYSLMRTHTALHMLSAVIWRDYQAQVTGGNMEPLKGRLDFELEAMNAELISEIERKVNAEVAAAHPVSARILSRPEAEKIPDLIRTKVNLLPSSLTEIRIVKIGDLDLQADGGTHVNNTEEVGKISIVKYKSKGRINKRIQIELEDLPYPR
ncbi:MAG: alanyl-tRNA editing protein [Candidatus Cloacimonetes bacterium]|nr:alanyl-tRNA editing protein [Candidatus Cloacimonadota bacterium]